MAVRVPEKLKARLQAYADVKEQSQASVIVEAIRYYLNDFEQGE